MEPDQNQRRGALVRAREAMILAVELFNTPRMAFKAGVFSMLTNVAWTYLLHEYYESKGVQIINKDGFSLLLSKMIARPDWPLSKACAQNLKALKEIRDVVEHRTIGPFDLKWLPLFQSTCLNFEKALTLAKSHLGLALIPILSYQNPTWDTRTDSPSRRIIGSGGRNETRSSSGNRMSG